MNFSKITTSMSKMTGRTGLILRKNSPEILMAVGITGLVATTVLACRATLKVEGILAEHEAKVDMIDSITYKVEKGEIETTEYTAKDRQKDLTIVYVRTAVGFLKLYGPALTLGAASIFCILGAHRIMKVRNVAIMAAYKAIEEGFSAYRKRVIDELGEEKDYMFKNGLISETVTETEEDEEGKTKKVKKNKLAPIDPNSYSVYARFFDEGNANWAKDNQLNFFFLKAQQNYFNDILKVRGHVFLNEVYDALGLERSAAGSQVGWFLNKSGDNYVDFGIFDGDRPKARDFVNGYERSILLDFNVDGPIYSFLP